LAQSAHQIAPGTEIGTDLIDPPIGAGGMGVVYSARRDRQPTGEDITFPSGRRARR